MDSKKLIRLQNESLKRIIRAKIREHIRIHYNPRKIPYVVFAVNRWRHSIVKYEIKKVYYDWQYLASDSPSEKGRKLAKMANKQLHKMRFYIHVVKYDPAGDTVKINMSLYWYIERIRLNKLHANEQDAIDILEMLKEEREISKTTHFKCSYCSLVEPVEKKITANIHFKSCGEERNFCSVQCAIDFQAEIYEEKTIKVVHQG